MEPRPVQYKGHRIEIKHYVAFRHQRREYPEVFDYVIFEGEEKVCKGYGLASLEEAINEARKFIDRVSLPTADATMT